MPWWKSHPRRGVILALIALKCAPSPTPTDDKNSPAANDTDTAVVRDTTVIDTAVDDTAPPAHVRPARFPTDWGPGFTAIDAALTQVVFPIDAGDVDADRPGDNTAVFWGDLDNDGTVELVVATSRGNFVEPRTAVLRWTGDELEFDAVLSAVLVHNNAAPIAAFDVDGDGFTDLLQGQHNLLVRYGSSDGTFSDWYQANGTPRLGADNTASGEWVTPVDIDADGWLDLWVTTGTCTLQQPLYRTGLRSFATNWDTLVPLWTSISADLPQMPAWRADGELYFFSMFSRCTRLPGSPPWELAEESHPGFYVQTSETQEGQPVFDVTDLTPTDAWWKLQPQYLDQPLTRLAPMGAAATDIDADGHLDFIMSTGQAKQAVLRGTTTSDFEAVDAGLLAESFPWAIGFPDLDHDGRPEVILTVGDDDSSFAAAAGQLMKNAVYWSGGTFFFEEFADQIGLAEPGNWRGLAMADPDHDGDADLAIGGKGWPSKAWRNDIDVGREGLSVKLRGTTSNHLGIGARVEVIDPWLPRQTGWMGAVANPLTTTDPILFFGAGDQGVVELVRVTWPSGTVQELLSVPTGDQLLIIEPPVIALSELDRHLDANGADELLITITPRTVTGDLSVPVAVEIAIVGGDATIGTVDHDGAGTWTASLTAPASRGSSQVIVTIDGVEVGIRPRVWWD